MEKSKLNRFQYNERIYNYKHGLVNSAENQTIEHSSENEEHIEHALPGTPGSYDYNSGRAKGWEWDDHKYIRKEERADGTIKYIYADGSSRIDDTNKVLGKPMRTAATGGTPGGSYTPPMKKTPNSNPVDSNAVNNSSYIPTQTNLTGGFNGTPGGSTYRKPVPGTPTGALGNGVTSSQPRDTFKANLQMGQGGTPTGLTGTYKESDPDAVRMTANVLTAQNYKKEAEKKAAERELYNGQGGTPTGLTGTYKETSQQAVNLAQGKGTPGGATGPSTTAGKYSAEVWSDIKNNVASGYNTDLANKANDRMTEIAIENQPNVSAGREAAEKAGQATIAEQQSKDAKMEIANKVITYMNSLNKSYENAFKAGLVDTHEEFLDKYVYPAEKVNLINGVTADLLQQENNLDTFFIKTAEKVYNDPSAMSTLDTLGNVSSNVNAMIDNDIKNGVKKETPIDTTIRANDRSIYREELTPAKAPDPVAHFKNSLNEWDTIGDQLNKYSDIAIQGTDPGYSYADHYKELKNLDNLVKEETGISYVAALSLINDIRQNNFNSYNSDDTEYAAYLLDVLIDSAKKSHKFLQ